jgi:TetR/AcrR family transcriptional regulator
MADPKIQDKHKYICRRRREREKAQRIQSIQEAAKRVFFSKGYLKATMDEIAMEAEITKPTIYLYYKAKDDLFFTLMLPLIEDIRQRLEKVEGRLNGGKIKDGKQLMTALFRAFYEGSELYPDAFRIIRLFQQQGLIGDLRPEIRADLNDKGRRNFNLSRRILTKGIELGIIRKVNVFEMADVIWGLVVGIIQLEDIKSFGKESTKPLKENTMHLAERLIADALTNLE